MANVAEKHVVQEKAKEAEHELHQLQDTWTYYLFLYKSSVLWEESIKKVATFGTIEHFWSVMFNTSPPSHTPNGTDIYMFRSDIEPKWEHPKNENGGRWLINLMPNSPIDRYWEELLMLVVGCDWETDEEAEQICGVVFQPRARGHKMAIWLTNAEESETIKQIGRRIKERLNLTEKMYFHTVEDQKNLPRGKDITSGRYEV